MERLTSDLLAKEITYLSFRDVVSLCQTEKRLHSFCMAETKRDKLIWKNLIQNAFSHIPNYSDKIKQLSEKYCSVNSNTDSNTSEDGTRECYNYLVYVNFVKLLDPVTQALIYYRQNDTDSLNQLSKEVKYYASFLLGNMREMMKNTPESLGRGVDMLMLKLFSGRTLGQNDQRFLNTLAFSMISKGYLPMVKYLIEEHGFDIHRDSDRAIMEAAGYGHLDLVKYLISKGANIRSYVPGLRNNERPLLAAIRHGHLDVAKYLVSVGSNIRDEDGFVLIEAIDFSRPEIAKYLVENGANVTALNDQPLMAAVQKGSLDLVKYLIEHGADINAREGAGLVFAVDRRDLEMTKFFIENGIRTRINEAFQRAVKRGSLDLVKYLLKNGADARKVGNDRLILYPIFDGDLEMVKLLIENGFNIQRIGKEALKSAEYYHYRDLANYLRGLIL